MGSWYTHHVYPRLMDTFLGKEEAMRRDALRTARGCVLEVGFGTGLNLTCYPPTIARLVTLDVAKMLPNLVEKRIGEVSFDVEQTITPENTRFPFDDNQFDCVVTTWTLCSVGPVADLLRELHRVLCADGEYLFLEHGRAINGDIANRQRQLNGVSQRLANGCLLDRPIPKLIEQSGFEIQEIKQFTNNRTLAVAGQMYQGIARRS